MARTPGIHVDVSAVDRANSLAEVEKRLNSLNVQAERLARIFDVLGKGFNTTFKQSQTLNKVLAGGTIGNNVLESTAARKAAVTGLIEDKKYQDQAFQLARLYNAEIEKRNTLLRAAEQHMVRQAAASNRELTTVEHLAELQRRITNQRGLAAREQLTAGDANRTQRTRLEEMERLERRLTAELREQARLRQQQIADQRKLERTRSAATNQPQLEANAQLGWAQRRATLGTNDGADLLAVQGRILLNYKLISAGYSSFMYLNRFVVELDQSFRNLQAITATTTNSMVGLREKLIEVSEGTKFSALEVAEAATTLGQAGFTAGQIEKSIGAIALLATATGTDLATSVDVASSAISVFNLAADEMGFVANVMTSAINVSKLTMDKLALGLQYASNLAAQSGVGFVELTAVISSLSNAGIRSGSTLGTGIRQLLVSFTDPTDDLVEQLASVGLTIKDVDIETQGLIGTFKNLRDSGFNAANAMRGLETRAGAALVAIMGRLDEVERIEQILLLSNAAAEANSIQMEGLSNTWLQFTNSVSVLYSVLSGPLLSAFQDILSTIADIISEFRQLMSASSGLRVAVQALFTAFTIFTGLKIAGWLLTIIGHMTGLRNLLPLLGVGFTSIAASSNAAAVGLNGLSTAFTFLRAAMGWITLGATVLLTAFTLMGSNSSDAAGEIEQLKAAVEEARTAVDDKAEAIQSLDDYLDQIIDRYARLKGNVNETSTAVLEAIVRFGDLGLALDQNTTDVNELITSLTNLRSQLAQPYIANMVILENASQAVYDARVAEINLAQAEMMPRLLELVGDSSGLFEGAMAGPAGTTPQGIRDILGAITGMGGVNASPAQQQAFIDAFTIPDPAGNLDNFSTTVSLLEQAQQNIATEMQGADEDAREMLQARLDFFSGLSTLMSEQHARVMQSEADRLQLSSAAINRAATVLADQTGAAAAVTEINTFIAEQERRILEIDDPNQRRQAAEDLTGAVQDLVHTAVESALQQVPDLDAEVVEGMNNNALFRHNIEPTFQALVAEAESISAEIVTSIGENAITTLERQISQGQRDFALRREVDTDVFATLDEEARQTALIVIQNHFDAQRLQAERLLRARVDAGVNEEGSNPFLAGSLDTEISRVRAELDAEQADLMDRLDNAVDSASSGGTSVTRFSETLRSLADQFKDLDKVMEAALYAAGATSRAADLRQESAAFPINRHVGDVQRYILERDSFNAETDSLSATVDALQDKVDGYREGLIEVTARRAEYEASFQRITGMTFEEAQATGALNENNAEAGQLYRQIGDAMDTERTAGDELITTTRELAETTAELTARSQELIGADFPALFDAAWEQWAEKEGLMKDLSNRMADSLGGAFTSIRDSFKTLVVDWVSGTATMGDAFRGLANSIIDSLLDIAATELANFGMEGLQSLVSMFLGGGGGGGLGGLIGSVGSIGGVGGSPVRPYSGGGPVFGGTPGRDSVGAALMPGEFVLRKSAVDAVGMDFLNNLNRGSGNLINAGIMPNFSARGNNSNNSNGVLNVWVVTPDQKPPMTENDVIAVVSENMMRSGSIKQLVKQVQLGTL